MNRRIFLSSFLAAAGAAIFDPSELLDPRRTYFLPTGRQLFDPETGLSIRLVRSYDQKSGLWISRYDGVVPTPVFVGGHFAWMEWAPAPADNQLNLTPDLS